MATKKAAKKTAKKATFRRPASLMPDAMAQFGAMLEQSGHIALGETAALLKSLHHLDMDGPDDEAHDDAQQLCFDAMEAESSAVAIRIYRKALKIDPDCVDAIAGLAQLTAKTKEDEIVELERAVQAGERYFGKKYFEENEGDFWGLIETRPYMRAKFRLGASLMNLGRLQEASAHFYGLLKLNPNDNQGVRETLLANLLTLKDLEGASALLKKYEEDARAVWLWGRVIQKFLSGKPTSVALRAARKGNPFVEMYLRGEKKPPVRQPDFYSPGSAEEAMLCLEELDAPLAAHAEVRAWLMDAIR